MSVSIWNSSVVVILAALSTACAQNFQPTNQKLASTITDRAGCADVTSLKADVWTELYRIVDEGKSQSIDRAEIEAALKSKLEEIQRLRSLDGQLSVEDRKSIVLLSAAGAELLESVIEGARVTAKGIGSEAGSDDPSAREIIKSLALLELGDSSSVEKAQVQSSVSQSIAKIRASAKSLDLECGAGSLPPEATPIPQPEDGVNTPPASGGAPISSPTPLPGSTPATSPTPNPAPTPNPTPAPLPGASEEGLLFDAWKIERKPAVYGMWKTIATAYQSCEAVELPALDNSTPNAKGVAIIKTNPKNGGRWREITDLTSYLRTNPYYQYYRTPPGEHGCFDVLRKPMIYDFGGKPSYTTSAPYSLDLFKQGGSGSTELGIDCSGLVVSAHMAAGLKLRSDVPLRPLYVDAIPARHIKDPLGYSTTVKLDCLKHVSATSAEAGRDVLQPGDMLASEGHVVMIDEVGFDPFGIGSIGSKAACTSTNVNPAKFNFVISHSAPVKGDIGITRMQASTYFTKGSTMSNGLVKYAIAACKARFGESSSPRPSEATLVRHSGESKCRAEPIALVKSSCLKSCRAPVSNLPR